MKSNKIDTNIKEKLANRTFEPSASAWERLSTQLDQQSKQQKRGWFFYIGYAASILVLISIGIYLFSDKEVVIIPENIIVDAPIDTVIIKNKIDKIFNEIPVEEVIVKNEKKVKEIKPKNVSSITEKKSKKKVNTIANNVNIIKKEINKKEIKNKVAVYIDDLKPLVKNQTVASKIVNNTNSRIKVSGVDLLYAVTHTETEVKAYYAKLNVTRDDVLKTIKSELKKSNLKVNPETILAEVESTIDDDFFKNNFLKSLKRRVTDIASAIASRND